MVANVFSYDAEKLANRRGMRHGVILGHLAAHELGHLLLGAGSHSARGIMHVPWRHKELDVIEQGLMVFTPQQAESMRTDIRARTVVEKIDGVALAPNIMSNTRMPVPVYLAKTKSIVSGGLRRAGV